VRDAVPVGRRNVGALEVSMSRLVRIRVLFPALLSLVTLLACQPSAAPAASKPAGEGASSGGAPSAAGAATVAPASTAPMAASAAPPAAAAAPPPLQVMKMGEARVFAGVPIYVAVEKGYFREQGIDLQFETITGGDSAAYLTTGQIDLSLDAIAVAFFNAIERGADMRIIAPAGVLTLEDSPLPLVVRKELVDNGEVRGPADLRGRRIAILARGATPEYLLTKVFDPLGMTINDIDPISMPFPDMPAALANGSIDAAVPAEPLATRAVSQGSAVKLVAAIAPGRMTTVISTSGQTLRDRPDLPQRWATAYLKGIRDLQPPALGVWDAERLYRPEHMAIYTQYLNVPEQVLRDQVPYTWDADLVIQGDSIMDIQQTHMRNGVLTLQQPVPLERMIAPGPSEYARQTLGRVRP
jgi:NitT/TauT family transport system substrate-binding protein